MNEHNEDLNKEPELSKEEISAKEMENLSLGDIEFLEQLKAEEQRFKEKEESTTKEEKSESQTEISEEKEEDPFLKEALDTGYDPEHKGEDFVSPKEWVRVGRKLKVRDSKIEELSKGMKFLLDHNKKVELQAYERAMKDLGAAKKAAIEEGNVAKVIQVDQQIAKKVQENQHVAQPTAPVVNKVTQDFVEENKHWFNNKPENVEIAAAAIHAYNFHRDVAIRKGLLDAKAPLTENQELELLKATKKTIQNSPDFAKYFEKSGVDKAKAARVGMVETGSNRTPAKETVQLTYNDRVQLKQIQLADKNFTEADFRKLKEQVQSNKR